MKKVLCLILAVAMLLACIPAAAAYSNVSEWAQEAVDNMFELGYLPESLKNADMTQNITRGEMCRMAVLVYRDFLGGMAHEEKPNTTDHFKDTKDPDFNYACEKGIVGGYPDGTFRPDALLIRQDFFQITHNLMVALYWTAESENLELDTLDRFADAAEVDSYATKATRTMVTVGVVKGNGDCLYPHDNTSRQEAILMFYRAYQYLNIWKNKLIEREKNKGMEGMGYENISSWAVQEVMEMQIEGLIPEFMKGRDMTAPISRADMCSIAMLAYNKATGQKYTAKSLDHFTDTSNPDVNAANELGIVGGVGGGKFDPDSTLQREQFFKIMGNFMHVLGYSKKDIDKIKLNQFTDVGSLSNWAVTETKMMVYSGTVRGDGSNLNPHGQTTNEEALAVFLRCYRYVVAWKATHPEGEESDAYKALINDIIAFAKSFKGYPYVYGGNGPNNFDCSGFVLYVYKHFGYSFSRGAQEQFHDGQKKGYEVKNIEGLLPGDLVFFCHQKNVNIYNSTYRSINHVGLYLGDGIFIHASNPTKGVIISHLDSGYYKEHFWGGCHVIMPKDVK